MVKKAKRSKDPSALLDTSIFYERLKLSLPAFSSKLDLLCKGQRFGVYYSAIELNLGMLQVWVGFYNLVRDLQSVPDALAAASNLYGRKSSTVLILNSLNARANSVVTCDNVDRYLDYLEASITNAVTILEGMVKDFIGEFSKHPLAKLVSLTRDNYQAFMTTCKEQKIVPIGEYLVSQKAKLQKLSKHIDQALLAHNTDKNRVLKKLVTETIDTASDCDKPKKNQKYGDIIIALNAPDSHLLVSKDAAFEILCGGLGKAFAKFS